MFANVKRAPVQLRERLAAIDGVAEVKLDVVFDAQIDLPGVAPPVTGRFIGVDLARVHAGRQGLNALTLKRGRWPEQGSALEALVSDRFAVARSLNPGDSVHAILNGKRERVLLVGTVASPEYVFASQGGAPDDQPFGIWWIDARAHDRGLRHAGRLQPGCRCGSTRACRWRRCWSRSTGCWRPMAPSARSGATSSSHRKIVDDELSQLKVMGTVLPSIFLAVAMFILNVVLSRQVATQRSQIAALKALGYSDAAIAWHYIQLALAIAGLGVAGRAGL